MPRQTSMQLTEATERQAETLKSLGFGSFSDIVRIAIDRMHASEVRYDSNLHLVQDADRADMTITVRRADVRVTNTGIGAIYEVVMTLSHGGRTVVATPVNWLTTERQSASDCRSWCDEYIAALPATMTPGEALREYHISYDTLAALGIPTPPQQRQPTWDEIRAYIKRTGNSYEGCFEERSQQYVAQLTHWAKQHPKLAAAYGI